MHIRSPTSTELDSIEATRRAYRAMWAELKDVPHRPFDGSRDDIDALDFIDYEAGHHPEGLAGAAVIWGGVIVATGALSWAIGDDQHFVLVGDPHWPRALIFPYARVAELSGSSSPQYGKYQWLLEEAVLRLSMQGFGGDVEQKLRALLRIEYDGFTERSQRWIKSTYPDLGRPA
ncbi:MAG: hypothetical protein K8S99_09450 [Planctomycetes bacterium]|nr:hypothetical protein [Planctomycetota bacterium]